MTATARATDGERGETTFNSNGTELFLRWARPKSGTVKATVLLVHGVGEHSGRYEHLERALLSRGYALYAFDLRGHGRSKGRRVHVNAFDDFVDDLAKVYEEVKSLAGGGKVFVLGHSMGGLIVTRWAAFRRPNVWGVIIDAPPFKPALPVPAIKIAAAKILSKIVPALALANEIDPKLLSRDANVAKAYMMDPLVERKATVRWGASILAAIEETNARAGEMDVPYLLMHGDCDGICSHEGSKEFHAKTRSQDKTIKIYPGCFHELHNEIAEDRDKYLSDLLSWLDQRA